MKLVSHSLSYTINKQFNMLLKNKEKFPMKLFLQLREQTLCLSGTHWDASVCFFLPFKNQKSWLCPCSCSPRQLQPPSLHCSPGNMSQFCWVTALLKTLIGFPWPLGESPESLLGLKDTPLTPAPTHDFITNFGRHLCFSHRRHLPVPFPGLPGLLWPSTWWSLCSGCCLPLPG